MSIRPFFLDRVLTGSQIPLLAIVLALMLKNILPEVAWLTKSFTAVAGVDATTQEVG